MIILDGMFPTTVWSTIRQAGECDVEALHRFAQRYRPAILDFIHRRGFAGDEADDLCQDVFLRLFSGAVLAKADPARGRLRSLLLTVTSHVISDYGRQKRRQLDIGRLQHEPAERDPDFDRVWALHLAEKALDQLEQEGSPYYQILRDHLSGLRQDRKQLWHARRKLIAAIRREIAMTCSSYREFEEEVAYLSPYLRPERKSQKS